MFDLISPFVRISSTNASLKNGEIKSNTYNYAHFKAVNTIQIRLNFRGNQKAQGILEWKVYTPSTITSSNHELPVPARFQVYPNPVTDQLTIESSGAEKSIIEIYNISGALVYSSSFAGSMRIKNSEIGTKNMYILKISSSGTSEYRKIVIN